MLVLSVAACQPPGDLLGDFRCDDDPLCPAGAQCIAGRCISSQSACATPDLLATTFDEPAWLPRTFNGANGVSARIHGGALQLTAADPSMFVTLTSHATYDVRERALTFEIEDASGAGSIFLLDAFERAAGFSIEDGLLTAWDEDATLARVPWSTVADRWWRLRESAGALYWETSADGERWKLLAQHTHAFDAAWVKVALDSWYRTPGGQFRIARIGPAEERDPRWCSARDWRDQFGDGHLAPEAQWYEDSCQISESDGALTMQLGNTAYCSHWSSRPIDAREGTFTFELTPAAAPATTSIELVTVDQRSSISVAVGDTLQLSLVVFDQQVFFSDAPRSASQRFWRLALSGSTLRFETSADAEQWNLISTAQLGALDASAVQLVRLATGNGPSTARFGALQ